MVVFFFFKQKTAYEMRISDWSSDVCSSDLVALLAPHRPPRTRRLHQEARRDHRPAQGRPQRACLRPGEAQRARPRQPRRIQRGDPRSEEHTSELQSLMRISYAVFCLKKKQTKNKNK